MKKRFALIAAALMYVAPAAVTSAHAKLDHCTPAAGATVASAPSQVVCVMSEEIDTKQSTMSVFDVNNAQVDNKDAHVDLNDPDHKTLLVTLDVSKVTNGIYTVKYHAVTPDDGGVTDGSFQFILGSAAATPAPTTQILQTAVATEARGAASTTPVAVTATVPSSQSTAAPSTAPTAGAAANVGWLLLALLGVAVLLTGVGLKVRR